MAVSWQVMIGLDDFVPFFLVPHYHLALSFPPFSILLLEIVGSSPLSYHSFVLLGRVFRDVGYCSSADEEPHNGQPWLTWVMARPTARVFENSWTADVGDSCYFLGSADVGQKRRRISAISGVLRVRKWASTEITNSLRSLTLVVYNISEIGALFQRW